MRLPRPVLILTTISVAALPHAATFGDSAAASTTESAEKMALSPDGQRVAYTTRDRGGMAIVIIGIDNPAPKQTLVVDRAFDAALAEMQSPTNLRFLRWATPSRLIFSPAERIVPLPPIKDKRGRLVANPDGPVIVSPIMMFDVDRKQHGTLVDARDFLETPNDVWQTPADLLLTPLQLAAARKEAVRWRMPHIDILGFEPAKRDQLIILTRGGYNPPRQHAVDINTGNITLFGGDWAAPPPEPLVFDWHRLRVVGERRGGSQPGTVWRDDDLRRVQQQLDAKFPRRFVDIVDWSETRSRVLFRVTGGHDAGRAFVFQRPEDLVLEILRRAPAVSANRERSTPPPARRRRPKRPARTGASRVDATPIRTGRRSRPAANRSLAVALCLTVASATGALQSQVRAAERPAATDAPVELPPMMVEESISSVPWLYVNAGSAEFLSRCSLSTTRQFVETWLAKMQQLRVLVPEEFFARSDVPAVFVLYAQDLNHTVSAEIQRELSGNDERTRGGGGSGTSRVNIAPNMRLTDRDMHASIAYIDEALFQAAAMNISPNHLRHLLKGRLPDLSAWLIEAVERAWRAVDLVAEPITLRPLVWIDPRESAALAHDATRPRAVLPANELFATSASRAAENRHPRRLAARASTQELFFRWAIATGAPTRDAFWKFAAHAAETPESEERFEAAFGFGYAQLRDHLSDYLPKAVTQPLRIEPGRLPAPEFEVERATRNQVARVRGEWERLAIGYVQQRLPQVREPYITQARRTLRRAYDAGDRDPRLLATMGLCEIDAGNEPAAREFLEPAVALGVVRPRAYYELARLRFAEIRRDAPEKKSYSFTELAPVFELLRRGLAQAPALPDAAVLLAEAWTCCDMPPNSAELAQLELAARLFTSRPAVLYPIALALARHGQAGAAAAALEETDAYATDEQTRAEIGRLRTRLAAVAANAGQDR